jgi:hypothetical protein
LVVIYEVFEGSFKTISKEDSCLLSKWIVYGKLKQLKKIIEIVITWKKSLIIFL